MERLAKALIIIALLLFASNGMAAESVAVIDTTAENGEIRIITWTYVSGTANITETTPAYHVTGEIVGILHEPSGVSTPASSADIILTNATSGVTEDILNSAGANIGATRKRTTPYASGTSEPVYLYDETMYFKANDLGADKAGTFKVFIKVP